MFVDNSLGLLQCLAADMRSELDACKDPNRAEVLLCRLRTLDEAINLIRGHAA